MAAEGHDIKRIEDALTAWLPADSFTRAAAIADYPILPEERALVANAVESRRREFATGRFLAREGLRSFGFPDLPILMGRLREPLWPKSIIGTISHDGGLCVVAVQKTGPEASAEIGIDLFSLARRPLRMDDLASMFVAHADELRLVAGLRVTADPLVLLFSLKEAVLKAISSQLTGFIDLRELEIRDVEPLTLVFAGTAYRGSLLALVAGEFLLTAVKIAFVN
jgi:4'-phosphopantetheinyl transferase EntD